VAASLLAVLPDEIAQVDDATLDAAPDAVSADPVLEASWRTANALTLEHWLRSVIADPAAPVEPMVAQVGVDLARDLVRRGLDATALDAYRAGQNVSWQHWMERCFAATADLDELQELLTTSARSIFAYVDATVSAITALVESERDVADELADLLEAAGVATYAYVTGEEALREVETLSATTGLDIALVAAQLPGIDGLETIRRLRDRIPGMPAFLVTSVVDADLAAHAADLGVVGFVQKPLADVDEIVARLAQLARDALTRTRESVYLGRIKERHERVLARYRALPQKP
jgi:CheY-like chemotaxis protein